MMNSYVRDLRDAFKEVDIAHYKLPALNKKGENYGQIAENNFTSELRRHFVNRMYLPENRERYEGLNFHMTVLKNRLYEPIEPDLVLHENQDNQNRQEIYIEVKLKFTANQFLIDDLVKLERAISTELNFNYGVMIVVNETLRRAQTIIRDFISERFAKEALRKLYLFHAVKNPENNTPIFTIENFLRIKNYG